MESVPRGGSLLLLDALPLEGNDVLMQVTLSCELDYKLPVGRILILIASFMSCGEFMMDLSCLQGFW